MICNAETPIPEVDFYIFCEKSTSDYFLFFFFYFEVQTLQYNLLIIPSSNCLTLKYAFLNNDRQNILHFRDVYPFPLIFSFCFIVFC